MVTDPKFAIPISNNTTFAAIVENLKGQNVNLELVNGRRIDIASPILLSISTKDLDLGAKPGRIF